MVTEMYDKLGVYNELVGSITECKKNLKTVKRIFDEVTVYKHLGTPAAIISMIHILKILAKNKNVYFYGYGDGI